MCGLVGMAGDLGGSKRRVFEELLLADVVRGPHSTGVGTVSRTNEMCVAKSVGAPGVLFDSREYHEAMRGQFKAYIGHNRYATIGKIDTDNAHPFVFDNTLGAHNGTIEYNCRQKLHNNSKFGTDSEAIFSHIDARGFKDTVKFINNPSYNTNAFALVWYDKTTNTINFAKNKKRPLYYMYSEDRCTIFWASEIGMLKWVLSRNDVKTSDDTVYLFEDDAHTAWKIPRGINDKFGGPIKMALEVPEPIVEVWKSSSYGGGAKHEDNNVLPFHLRGDYNHHRGSSMGFGRATWPGKKKKAELIDVDKWRPPYKDHKGHHLTKPKVEKMVKDGCVFCTDASVAKFKWGDFIFPLKPDMDGRPLYLCKDCYADDDIRELIEELV